jgi:hypothetical protein
MVCVAVFNDHGQTTAHEIERHFIDLAVTLWFHKAWRVIRKPDNRLIHQIFDAALVVAVQPRQFQHRGVFLAVRVDMVFEDDFILRQRAGFIGT